jgi:hypothetical protein
MNLKKERELVVFTYLLEKGLRPINEIQTELEMNADEDFQFENTLNDLAKEGYLEQKSSEMPTDQSENLSWEITKRGKIHMNDLAQEKYEEKNKMPVIIWAVIIVIAVLAFMRVFPRMFH